MYSFPLLPFYDFKGKYVDVPENRATSNSVSWRKTFIVTFNYPHHTGFRKLLGSYINQLSISKNNLPAAASTPYSEEVASA